MGSPRRHAPLRRGPARGARRAAPAGGAHRRRGARAGGGAAGLRPHRPAAQRTASGRFRTVGRAGRRTAGRRAAGPRAGGEFGRGGPIARGAHRVAGQRRQRESRRGGPPTRVVPARRRTVPHKRLAQLDPGGLRGGGHRAGPGARRGAHGRRRFGRRLPGGQRRLGRPGPGAGVDRRRRPVDDGPPRQPGRDRRRPHHRTPRLAALRVGEFDARHPGRLRAAAAGARRVRRVADPLPPRVDQRAGRAEPRRRRPGPVHRARRHRHDGRPPTHLPRGGGGPAAGTRLRHRAAPTAPRRAGSTPAP